MNISIRKAGPVTILDLDGPLKLGDAEEAFRTQVQQLVESGSTHVAVNLAAVTELDSSGIGALERGESAPAANARSSPPANASKCF